MTRCFTDEEEAQIVREYAREKNCRILADRWHCSHSAMRKLIERHGALAGRTEFNAVRNNEILQLRAQGVKVKTIAEMVHMTPGAVSVLIHYKKRRNECEKGTSTR